MPGKYADQSLLDPLRLRDVCIDLGAPYEHWFGKANLFRVPLGKEPGRGAVLLTKADLDAIDQTTFHDLVFDDGKESVTLKNIYITGAKCVLPGGPGNPQDAYLVDLADRRIRYAGSFANEQAAYNLRSYDGTVLLDYLGNSGSSQTWQEVFDSLWSMVQGVLPSSAPTLPFTPHGTPENFDYRNTDAWDSVNNFLDRLACAVKHDPIADETTIVRLGVDDSTASGLLTSLKPKTWDEKPIRSVPATRPQSAIVLFRRFPEPFNRTDRFYRVGVDYDPAPGGLATSVFIYDDMGAVGPADTPTNASDLADRAAERAADWLRKYDGYDLPTVKVYSGVRRDVKDILGSSTGLIGFGDRGDGLKSEIATPPDRRIENWRPPEPHDRITKTILAQCTDAPSTGIVLSPATGVNNFEIPLNSVVVNLLQDADYRTYFVVAEIEVTTDLYPSYDETDLPRLYINVDCDFELSWAAYDGLGTLPAAMDSYKRNVFRYRSNFSGLPTYWYGTASGAVTMTKVFDAIIPIGNPGAPGQGIFDDPAATIFMTKLYVNCLRDASGPSTITVNYADLSLRVIQMDKIFTEAGDAESCGPIGGPVSPPPPPGDITISVTFTWSGMSLPQPGVYTITDSGPVDIVSLHVLKYPQTFMVTVTPGTFTVTGVIDGGGAAVIVSGSPFTAVLNGDSFTIAVHA